MFAYVCILIDPPSPLIPTAILECSQIMLIAFFWETVLVVIYAKILDHNFIPTIYKKFFTRAYENLETFVSTWF